MRRIRALLVLRLLLVANAVVVSAVGGLTLAYVERPAGALFMLVPYTDPYRVRRRRPRAGAARPPGR